VTILIPRCIHQVPFIHSLVDSHSPVSPSIRSFVRPILLDPRPESLVFFSLFHSSFMSMSGISPKLSMDGPPFLLKRLLGDALLGLRNTNFCHANSLQFKNSSRSMSPFPSLSNTDSASFTSASDTFHPNSFSRLPNSAASMLLLSSASYFLNACL